ncbi:MAG: response regulator [Candidatus Paceibacterota bacterium]
MNPFDVLLIEDNEGDVTLVKEAFDLFDYKVNCIIRKDGEKAISYLEGTLTGRESRFPDLILLDLNLPRKNGLEVLEFVKTHKTLKVIPTVVFTTSSSEIDISACYQRHANCFITKPAEIESYLEVLQGIQHFWIEIVRVPSGKN